jgi:hypothetical protein
MRRPWLIPWYAYSSREAPGVLQPGQCVSPAPAIASQVAAAGRFGLPVRQVGAEGDLRALLSDAPAAGPYSLRVAQPAAGGHGRGSPVRPARGADGGFGLCSGPGAKTARQRCLRGVARRGARRGGRTAARFPARSRPDHGYADEHPGTARADPDCRLFDLCSAADSRRVG